MPPLPKLKTALRVLPLLLTGAALGFASAVLAVRLTGSGGSGDGSGSGTKAPSPHDGGISPLSAPAAGKRTPSLPAAGDFQKMEPRDRLACAFQLRGLSAEQRQAFLQDCLQRSAPERTPLLSLLLSEWAESEPSRAAEWILSHLKGAEAQKCQDDVLRTWAARDAQALAEWADAQYRKEDRGLTFPAMKALERHAPLWFARMSEMECNRGTVSSNMEFPGLRAPGAAKAMSSRLDGHVAYVSDAAEMRRALATGSTGRHQQHKWGWNELFETTAVQWHAEDPAACDQWLSTWPENAQAAARYFISEAESKAKANTEAHSARKKAPKSEPGTKPEPSVLSGSSHPASPPDGPTSPPAPSPPLPDAAAPASGAGDQQLQLWSQWLRRDAAAAEAFLKSAAWPEDLKFRARSQAYSSAP
ncbi:MAG: hypothetical protein V4726_23265 [Verrucomicrobiota bacterium]